MQAEWSVECSAEDPVLVVPWKDPDGTAVFVDLRANPYDFDAIPEAEHHPPLMQALRSLNATRSPVFTAKCDAWRSMPKNSPICNSISTSAPRTHPRDSPAYIDLVARERTLFTSFHRHEQLLRRLTRLAAPLDYPNAALACVLRPALVDLEGPQQGYAFSLYIKALGADPHAALEAWAAALEAAVALVRAKDLTR